MWARRLVPVASAEWPALASLEEHADGASPRSQAVIAVTIYQNLMAIPVLAVIPVLASSPQQAPMPTVLKTLEVCAVLAAVYLLARYALPQALAFAARKHNLEGFTAIVIAAIFAAAWVMDTVGL